jgi:hypothetical protein
MATAGNCRNCIGTGKVLLLNSHFTEDGYRRERCAICEGTGRSKYKPDTEWVRFQARAARQVEEWGGLKPRDLARPDLSNIHPTMAQAIAPHLRGGK